MQEKCSIFALFNHLLVFVSHFHNYFLCRLAFLSIFQLFLQTALRCSENLDMLFNIFRCIIPCLYFSLVAVNRIAHYVAFRHFPIMIYRVYYLNNVNAFSLVQVNLCPSRNPIIQQSILRVRLPCDECHHQK